MGSDTFERLFLLKYYDSESERKEQLRKLLEFSNIEVVGRKDQNKINKSEYFKSPNKYLEDAIKNNIIDSKYLSNIKCYSESDFRIDISSSEIRQQNASL